MILHYLLQAASWLTGRTGVVLLYHGATSRSGVYLQEAHFAAQMEMLAAEFRIVAPDEYLTLVRRGRSLPRKSILITFDDGFRNNLTVVDPIMRRLQLPWVLLTTTAGLRDPGATLWMSMMRGILKFLPNGELSFLGREWPLTPSNRAETYKQINHCLSHYQWSEIRPRIDEFLGSYGHYVPSEYVECNCRLLSAGDLRQLSGSGLVEIGAHTITHPFLTNLSDAELDQEIRVSRDTLAEALDRPIRTFAYPSGVYGRREVEHAMATGFDCAFAVSTDRVVSSRFEVPRVGVYSPNLNVLRLKAHVSDLVPVRKRLRQPHSASRH